jgi:hypothetical protein
VDVLEKRGERGKMRKEREGKEKGEGENNFLC